MNKSPTDYYDQTYGSSASPDTSSTRSMALTHYIGNNASYPAQGDVANLYEVRNTLESSGIILGFRSTVYYGGSISTVASKNNAHAFSGENVITGVGLQADGQPAEQSVYYGITADRTTGSAQSGRLWVQDMLLFGSQSSVANYLFIGNSLMANKYQSGATGAGIPSVGVSIATYAPQGALQASHSGAQTYPIDYGLLVTGDSGTADHSTTITQGFSTAIGSGARTRSNRPETAGFRGERAS